MCGYVQALWANVQSLLSAYDARATTVHASTLFFRHHPGLQAHRGTATAAIEEMLAMRMYAQALPMISELGHHAEASLLYLQRYHWLLLYSVVVAQYVLWILWVMLELLRDGGGGQAGANDSGVWADVVRKAEVTVYGVMAIVLAVLANLKVPVRLWDICRKCVCLLILYMAAAICASRALLPRVCKACRPIEASSAKSSDLGVYSVVLYRTHDVAASICVV